jgi:CubicO group peptidase (beta-lactamase class C family)
VISDSIVNTVLVICYCLLFAMAIPDAVAQEDGGVSVQKIVPKKGDEFIGWIESDDWIGNAVRRDHLSRPVEVLLYSSGNSHFLSALIRAATGKTPGEYAQERIFGPLSIKHERAKTVKAQLPWDDFLVREPCLL